MLRKVTVCWLSCLYNIVIYTFSVRLDPITVTVLSIMPLCMLCLFPLGLYSLLDLLNKLGLSYQHEMLKSLY